MSDIATSLTGEIGAADLNNLTCRWCKVKFKNRGNLTLHAFHMHSDASYQLSKPEYGNKCKICNISFAKACLLKYHIREQHYNLIARQPYCDLKKVNQVWFEKVLNSNAIVEMKKIEMNMLLIRKLDDNTSIKVSDNVTESINLHQLYPTGQSKLSVECKVCLNRFSPATIKKHIQEKHLNIVKHRCNNCNLPFKRSYQYLKHKCYKLKDKVRGDLKECDKHFKISSMESFSVPMS